MPLLDRLQAKKYVDQIFISDSSALAEEKKIHGIEQSIPIDFLKNHWHQNNKLIFIGSIGAVVRLISPFVRSKENDPAILVMDSQAKNVVTLLGGHKQGGDRFATELASALDADPIFTSDSFIKKRIPLDCFGEGWGWRRGGGNVDWRKLMISQSKEQKNIIFQSKGSKLWQQLTAASNFSFLDNNDQIPSKNIDLYIGQETINGCSWHPPSIIIGIGCERNTDEKMIQRAIEESFTKNGLSLLSISCIATIDKKNNEIGLLNLSKRNEWPIYFFSAHQLSKVKVPTPSNVVMNEMGTASVAEAAALLKGSERGRLIQKKQIYYSKNDEVGAVTIALVEVKIPFAPHKGELHLIGSGPGELEMLTSDARKALARCVAWVGYAPYLNYLDSIRRHDQVRIDSQLTFEKDRCQHALDLAKEGIRVALVSSGDSGIYGMAGLALELWLDEPVESRPLFQVHPGISAFQMAAAKLGAPFMNDFCSISLSDLLTPWNQIELRLNSAAQGDFVIAIFNPKSIKRNWQLKKAVDLLLEFRKPSTPVAIARQLGRPEESIEIHTLETLPFDQVDMLTILLIGNSQSFIKNNKFLTPRGYFSN
ncbi:precorrin-3B C(17)-methyltransferase [Prochlorococcus marinus]|uniref:Precorrin-3B C(17)-methyltransferase n=1 Tax=Prochlorococcus marinus XMU1408 TaxID=2213228 RepID=A0A318R2R6_PROMR|nr:precorrin-3B C(17)-methyltransferase [Prochlorococcus marinus]MBW3042731.1 precorrin-3B C(17)-methyltransferase [Prochlorococcus marinus str. XMU1408]PYE01417.1 precorrin-3B C(17)-methyltransferase [Prochlorococcus marinus XMU1408]